MPSSAAYNVFTNSMIAEMQVLKCQRPWKSSLTRLIVWCSLRWMGRGSGDKSSRNGFGARLRRQFRWNRLTRVRMIEMRIPHKEAVHAPEKSLDAFDPAVLPIEIA